MKVKGYGASWQPTPGARGHFYVREDPKHGQIAQSWPRARVGPGSPAQQDSQKAFSQAVRWARNPMQQELQVALDLSKDTGYLPRDVLISAIYGRLVVAYMKNGKTIRGVRDLAGDIQALLDSIADAPGTILVRTATGWSGIAAGLADDVLTAGGAGVPPRWAPVTAGGGGGGLFSASMTTVPSIGGVGFTGWFEQAGATATSEPYGIRIQDPAHSGDHQQGLYRPASTSPYLIRALMQLDPTETNYAQVGLGWRDSATGKMLLLQFLYSSAFKLSWQSWQDPTHLHLTIGATVVVPYPQWITMQDDGTNVSFGWSTDGANFVPLYSVAKAGSYLGASGYDQVVLTVSGTFTAAAGSVMAYDETAI
ncbi:MAG: hypothetical protein WCB49_13105 [Gammaproteobacteria bacterium]